MLTSNDDCSESCCGCSFWINIDRAELVAVFDLDCVDNKGESNPRSMKSPSELVIVESVDDSQFDELMSTLFSEVQTFNKSLCTAARTVSLSPSSNLYNVAKVSR